MGLWDIDDRRKYCDVTMRFAIHLDIANNSVSFVMLVILPSYDLLLTTFNSNPTEPNGLNNPFKITLRC